MSESKIPFDFDKVLAEQKERIKQLEQEISELSELSESNNSDLYPANVTSNCNSQNSATLTSQKQDTQEKNLNSKAKYVRSIAINHSCFILPGMGDITSDRCGEIVFGLKCSKHPWTEDLDKNHDRFCITKKCYNPRCPLCYPEWTRRHARKSTLRLVEGRKLYNREGYEIERGRGKKKRIYKMNYMYPFDHVILFPDQDEAYEAGKSLEVYKKKLKTKARKLLLKNGCLGGLITFHPFTQNIPSSEYRYNTEEYHKEYREDIPAYSWYWSPHFHVISTGFLLQSDLFYKKTGWGYKKLEIDSDSYFIGKLIEHLCDHTGIPKEGRCYVISYFGLFSYSKLKMEKWKKVKKNLNCKHLEKKCRQRKRKLHYIKPFLDEETGEMIWVKCNDMGKFEYEKWKYKFRKKDKIIRKKNSQRTLSILMR